MTMMTAEAAAVAAAADEAEGAAAAEAEVEAEAEADLGDGAGASFEDELAPEVAGDEALAEAEAEVPQPDAAPTPSAGLKRAASSVTGPSHGPHSQSQNSIPRFFCTGITDKIYSEREAA